VETFILSEGLTRFVLRRKTSTAFSQFPFTPQARPLLEKLCAGKAHNESYLTLSDARKH